MNKDPSGYAVFFFPPALEALGDAIKPYLQDGPAGPHLPCREVDTAGAFTEITLEGRTPEGRDVALELMVPSNMVRMIVSARADAAFGFHDRHRVTAAMLEPGVPALPPAAAQPVVESAGAVQAPVDAAPRLPASGDDGRAPGETGPIDAQAGQSQDAEPPG